MRPPAFELSDGVGAFASISTPTLLHGAAVLTACSQPWLARNSEALLKLSTRLLGWSITERLVRHTIFAHFVAGEDEHSIVPTIQALEKRGVGAILDYAAEADVAELTATDFAHIQKNVPANIYPYESEKQCDANLDIFLTAVRSVANVSPDGFAAVKVTALGDPALLERVSVAVKSIHGFFFDLWKEEQSRAGDERTSTVSRESFIKQWVAAFDVDVREAELAFLRFDSNGDGSVDLIEFTSSLALEAVPELAKTCLSKGPLAVSALTPAEITALKAMLHRLDRVAELARELGVRLMIDAEQSYFQPAIDHAVLTLQRQHNVEYPCVFNTYQAYLVECGDKLDLDLERAQREGWHFACKLVRGAYMVTERERAAERGCADPVHQSVEATHASYDGAIDTLLMRCPQPSRTAVLFATHNAESVAHAARLLLSGESLVPAERVAFGQLLGMADHLTFGVAAASLKAYKYVPYGPVREVVPYLVRRARENSDALSGAIAQRTMMLAEVRRRLIGS